MSLVCTSPPTSFILSLADAQAHCRVTDSADDALLGAYIAAAQVSLERLCTRVWSDQQWTLSLPYFPQDGANARPVIMAPPGFWWASALPGVPHNFNPFNTRAMIRLPFPPIDSIDDFTYVDRTGVAVNYTSDLYQLDAGNGLIAPAYGTMWPNTQPNLQAVQITFTVGTAPEAGRLVFVQQAVKLTVATWYENREAGAVPDVALQLLLAAGERTLI